MADKKGKGANGGGTSLFHNPAPLPAAPQQQRSHSMAKNTKSSRHANSSKGAGEQNPGGRGRGKGGGKKGSKQRRHKNPTIGIGSLGLMDLLAAGGGALVTQVITNVIPLGAAGSWLNIAEGFGVAYGVHKLAPRSVRASATAGAVAAPVVALVNKLVPGLQGQITNFVNRLSPLPPGAGAPAGVGGWRGYAGLVDVPRNSPAYQGLIG